MVARAKREGFEADLMGITKDKGPFCHERIGIFPSVSNFAILQLKERKGAIETILLVLLLPRHQPKLNGRWMNLVIPIDSDLSDVYPIKTPPKNQQSMGMMCLKQL
mmetsp:Transcript_5028/g.5798  ORF Transcript_5028/g.5798 Transcript_5028/m.5798 type:complete len:106 (-) Transcript_5028:47-364(-)